MRDVLQSAFEDKPLCVPPAAGRAAAERDLVGSYNLALKDLHKARRQLMAVGESPKGPSAARRSAAGSGWIQELPVVLSLYRKFPKWIIFYLRGS